MNAVIGRVLEVVETTMKTIAGDTESNADKKMRRHLNDTAALNTVYSTLWFAPILLSQPSIQLKLFRRPHATSIIAFLSVWNVLLMFAVFYYD